MDRSTGSAETRRESLTTVRIGVIGLGAHGTRYARHLAAGEVEGARLAAVCRRNRLTGEAMARELGVSFVSDYRVMLADPAVDAVAVVVPCDLHPSLVSEALAAGKAVLVEKPLAPDAAGATAILEAARASTRPAMVAQTLRFHPVVRALRERVADLGRLRFAALSQRFEPSARPWLDEPAAGGILRNTGIHSFDLLRHLTGREAEVVSCYTAKLVTRKTEDAFAALLEMSGGFLATVDNHRATASRTGRIELVGEDGQLLADHVHHRLEEIRGTTRRTLDLPSPVPTVRECLAAFAAAVRGERPVAIPLIEGLRALEIVDAGRRSAETAAPSRVERTVFG